MSQKTPAEIQSRKNAVPVVCLTAYSTPMAKLLDPYCDLLLVGDSIGMALYGMEDTLGVTLDIMINHGKAVMRGAELACVVVDMPYGTYEDNSDDALKNAKRIIDETGCHAVKLEGGVDVADTIAHLVENGVPVMAHIGLQPQSVRKEGGYRVKGKTDEDAARLIKDAQAIEKAGAFSVVIEGTIESVSADITKTIGIPTIGIGASASCDGQVLVSEDMLGLTVGHVPKFAREYAHLRDEITRAATAYAADVRSRAFPADAEIYKKKN